MLKIGVLVSGGGTNLQAVINSINAGETDAEIVGVVSSRAGAYALERAKKNGIDAVFISRKQAGSSEEYERSLIKYFKEKNAELILLAGFMVILTPLFVNAFKGRIMNIHPSLIPAFCGEGFYGLKVHEAALARGVKLTGATVQLVNDEPDGGPIILQKAVEVRDNDTPETLQKRVMEEAEWKLYPEAVKLFAQNRLVLENGRVRIKEKL